MKWNIDWEDAFLSILWGFCLLLAVSIGTCTFSKKYTKKYTLGKEDGCLTITKEREWDMNVEIKLDRSVTYWDAIRMVDSLNKTLK